MTAPSIPDLIAALEEHDAAMTSGPWNPWRPTINAATYGVLGRFRGETDCLVAQQMTEGSAAGIAWFGTHRGALVEALREVDRLRAEHADLVEVIDSCRGYGHGTSPADAVRYIRKLYTDLLHGAYATAQSDLDATVKERDAAIAARDSAVAEVAKYKAAVAAHLHADMANVLGKSTELEQARRERDSAANDTAERIAAWLDECSEAVTVEDPQSAARQVALYTSAEAIRAGAWRGQNGRAK